MTTNNTATIQPTATQSSFGPWRDKAEHYKSAVICTPEGMRTLIKCIIKYPRDGMGRVTAALWILGADETLMHGNSYRHGIGTASGCGYHKASAAIKQAMRDAGIELAKDIGGVGNDAVNDALIAIACAVTGEQFENRKNILIVE